MSEIWQSLFSRRYQVVKSDHVFISLCDSLNYNVVNSDIQDLQCF